MIILKHQGVPTLARYALPEFEVHNDVDQHLDLELMITFFYDKEKYICFLQTIERAEILDRADRLPERGVHILGPVFQPTKKHLENTISISAQFEHIVNESILKKYIECIHTITLKHNKIQVKEANVDLDIIEPEVQDFSVFRGNSGVSLFLLSFKQKVFRVPKLWQR